MTYLSKIQRFLLLLSVFCLAPIANASDDVSKNFDLNLTTGTTSFSRASIASNATFTDKYFFTLGSGYDLVSASLSGNNLASSLNWSVFKDDSTSPIGTAASGLTINFSGVQAAGDYVAVITGKSTGNSFSHYYSGSFQVVSVSPVPEAQTYAMLLAGLGLIGLLSRRRQHNGTAVPA